MAFFSLSHIAVRGISTSVPSQTEDNESLELIPANERKAFIESTGIRYRHIAPSRVTAADLCLAAASELVNKLSWSTSELDVLIFVTQTPDYIIPNTASVIHQRMGMAKKCVAMDINLGCSGYVYGLSVISALMQSMPGAKGLLLVGDCSSAVISKSDKSTWPLFSDAGSATALEYSTDAGPIHFHLQTDGAGHQDIMIKSGGQRNPFSAESLRPINHAPGIERNDLQMKLDGINIFNFALREVAPNIETLLSKSNTSQTSIDHFVLHQANKLILECVRKKLKEPEGKFPYSLYHYGNTSSASIPVTIVSELAEKLYNRQTRLLLCGFGVGLSWASAVVDLDSVIILPMIRV